MSSAPPTHKGETFPAEVLTPDEVRALLRAPSRRAPTGVRNCALMAVMVRAGLRLAEALALNVGDIKVTGEVHVRRGKGGKQRRVGLDPGALALVDRWSDRRASLGLDRRGVPLFCTLAGEALEPRYVRAMVARMAERAGIDHRVNPHSLRHTFAREVANERVPMHLIRDALGHQHLGTTGQYLQRVAPVEVVGMLTGRPPLEL